MRYQSLEINYHTAPNNKSTALPILQKLISIMVCLLGRAEYVKTMSQLRIDVIVTLLLGLVPTGMAGDPQNLQSSVFQYVSLINDFYLHSSEIDGVSWHQTHPRIWQV